MGRRSIGLVLILMLAVGAGCAKAAGPGAGADDPNSPVTSSPVDPNSPIPSPSPRIVEPRDGLKGVHPNAFERAVAMDDDTVRVEYYLGVEECYGLDRVDVEYGEEVVIITLFTGNVPGDRACIEIAEFVATIVELDEPLDGRRIVDGSEDASGS